MTTFSLINSRSLTRVDFIPMDIAYPLLLCTKAWPKVSDTYDTIADLIESYEVVDF